MAIIENAALAQEINRRMRPRAEQVIGLSVILQDDLAALSALGVEASADVIDDGAQGPIAFTRQHFVDYLGLVQALLAGGADATVMAAAQGLKVRSIDVIISGMAGGADTTGLDPVAAALRSRIRPRAMQIRALRFQASNDVRVMGMILAGLDNADQVDDGRSGEGLAAPYVWQLAALVGFLQAATGSGVNNEAAALAIDAACTIPLEVR